MMTLKMNNLRMFSYINCGNNNRIWKTVYIMLTVLNILQSPIVALKCYICGDPDNVLLNFNITPQLNPISCDELNRLRNDTIGISTTTTTTTGIKSTTKLTSQDQMKLLEKFTMKCPEDYQGCITQIQDGKVTRSCDVMPIDDCETANGVTYCYCSYDLCNIDDETKSNSVSTRTQTSFKSLIIEKSSYISPYFDDEDYSEMSGDKNLDIKEIESENSFDTTVSNSGSIDLNRIAKEHNEKKSTILTVISTTLPTKNITTTTTNINSPQLNIIVRNITTINSNINEDNKTKAFSSTTHSSTTTIPTTSTTTTTSNNNNNSIYMKENSWQTFRIKTYDNQENNNNQQSTTKRTIDLFPTTNIYNRNSDTNRNHCNLIKFYIYLLIIPIILIIKI
ncbi:putative uncharacterized protein DDB_G0277255 [Condylostylus longicornis]|uniref:putative uncharacterized protein DDB_G0277255 n=1 Tax=Condylostylus longicornis TaxID=2530218 RepID=UPI00244E3FD3|nr:putative uncharacterized protein DDB_G0277255 [Condylostylus longicornis]